MLFSVNMMPGYTTYTLEDEVKEFERKHPGVAYFWDGEPIKFSDLSSRRKQATPMEIVGGQYSGQ